MHPDRSGHPRATEAFQTLEAAMAKVAKDTAEVDAFRAMMAERSKAATANAGGTGSWVPPAFESHHRTVLS